MVHSEDDTFLHSNIHKRNYQLFMNVCFLFLYIRVSILTFNTSKQFKVASILLSQFKCITILWFLSEDLYTGEVCCRLSHICTQSDECIFSDGPKKNMREPITWLCLIPIITIIIGSFIIQRVRWNSFIYTIMKQTWNKCL